MCRWVKSGNQRIDPCMKQTLHFLEKFGFNILACCCGHGKYPQTIVYQNSGGETFAAVVSKSLPAYLLQNTVRMPRKKRFYKRDLDGVFFIPEIAFSHAHSTDYAKP